MDLSVIFWALGIFVLLQPLVRQRILESVRRRKILQIEQARGSRVILLVHREERVTCWVFPSFATST